MSEANEQLLVSEASEASERTGRRESAGRALR
jgi:hypothetical protein